MTAATLQALLRPTAVVTATLGAAQSAYNRTTSWAFSSLAIHISGGSGSYTYAWSHVDGADGTWPAASGATPAITVTGVTLGRTATSAYKCAVTDTGLGVTVNTNAVTLQYTNIPIDFHF